MAEPPVSDIPPPDRLLDMTGQVVVVTGSSRGIGAGIARRFAQAGADVVIHYQASAEKAGAVAAEIEAMGRRVLVIQADLREKSAVDRLLDGTVEALGKINVLVNNAAQQPLAPLMEMTEADWDLVIDANLKGVFLCTQAAARHMIRQGTGGAIVNIGSIEGENPAPRHSHYVASKGGVNMHTMNAALELGPYGIRVNVVSPGLIWSPTIHESYPQGVSRYESRAPLGRIGMPEDVADACLFLASPAARWISGVNLRVDGGVMTSQIY